jgi:hypothetical protein
MTISKGNRERNRKSAQYAVYYCYIRNAIDNAVFIDAEKFEKVKDLFLQISKNLGLNYKKTNPKMKLSDIKEGLAHHLSSNFRISVIVIDNIDMGLSEKEYGYVKSDLAELVKEVETVNGRYLKVICIEQKEAAENESEMNMLDLKNTLRRDSEDEDDDEDKRDDNSESENDGKYEENKANSKGSSSGGPEKGGSVTGAP